MRFFKEGDEVRTAAVLTVDTAEMGTLSHLTRNRRANHLGVVSHASSVFDGWYYVDHDANHEYETRTIYHWEELTLATAPEPQNPDLLADKEWRLVSPLFSDDNPTEQITEGPYQFALVAMTPALAMRLLKYESAIVAMGDGAHTLVGEGIDDHVVGDQVEHVLWSSAELSGKVKDAEGWVEVAGAELDETSTRDTTVRATKNGIEFGSHGSRIEPWLYTDILKWEALHAYATGQLFYAAVVKPPTPAAEAPAPPKPTSPKYDPDVAIVVREWSNSHDPAMAAVVAYVIKQAAHAQAEKDNPDAYTASDAVITLTDLIREATNFIDRLH